MKIAHNLSMQIEPFVKIPTDVEGTDAIYSLLKAVYVPHWDDSRYMVTIQARSEFPDHYTEKEFSFISKCLFENRS